MTGQPQSRPRLRRVRLLLWLLAALAVAGMAALLLIKRVTVNPPQTEAIAPAQASFGGPFTLVGADGKPFSSIRLAGKPYAIYFGFTRCADVCPTTLSRLVKLRQKANAEGKLNLVFVTIDPLHDGPKEVGQYASLFNAPIIGLTGTPAQIDQVKKQYGIFAEPTPNAPMGKEMEHTATVLLFDRGGRFVGTIAPNESDVTALAAIKQLVGRPELRRAPAP